MEYLNIVENEYTKYYIVNKIYELLNSLLDDYLICEEKINFENEIVYKDVTEKWLLDSIPNSHKILNRNWAEAIMIIRNIKNY